MQRAKPSQLRMSRPAVALELGMPLPRSTVCWKRVAVTRKGSPKTGVDLYREGDALASRPSSGPLDEATRPPSCAPTVPRVAEWPGRARLPSRKPSHQPPTLRAHPLTYPPDKPTRPLNHMPCPPTRQALSCACTSPPGGRPDATRYLGREGGGDASRNHWRSSPPPLAPQCSGARQSP